jgi:hypothetical protein
MLSAYAELKKPKDKSAHLGIKKEPVVELFGAARKTVLTQRQCDLL